MYLNQNPRLVTDIPRSVLNQATMRSLLILLVFCLLAVLASAQEERRKNDDKEILDLLRRDSEQLNRLDDKVQGISNSQKSIEQKIRQQRAQLEGIARLEEGLTKLQLDTSRNFQLTASGVKNLTGIIRSFEVKNDKALQDLGKGSLEIKQVLRKVDVNQNKYEKQLNEVSKSVEQHIAGLNKLLKESIIKDLYGLDRTAKQLGQTQRNIEHKVAYLDELSALAGIANFKVDQLEQGVRSLNRTQNQRLSYVGDTIQKVHVSTYQVDQKLAALLSNQKSIEKTLDNCKKWQRPTQPDKPHDLWPLPGHGPTYE